MYVPIDGWMESISSRVLPTVFPELPSIAQFAGGGRVSLQHSWNGTLASSSALVSVHSHPMDSVYGTNQCHGPENEWVYRVSPIDKDGEYPSTKNRQKHGV